MLFRKTRKYIKAVKETVKISKKLCNKCKSKAAEINKNRSLWDGEFWCEGCKPIIDKIRGFYNTDMSKEIVEEKK